MPPERVAIQIFESSAQASAVVARQIADLVRQRASEERIAVLGLATGHAPVKVYEELVRMHREEGLDFANVVAFNLDEYWPIDPAAYQSFHRWMHERFFSQVNVPRQNIHMPSGAVPEDHVEEYCREYEQLIAQAGGIDYQILGIGRSGHIGFNEPGSARESVTRVVHLDKLTRMDAAGSFFGEENVPKMAITMGVGTVMRARRIALLAFGEHKAMVVRRAVEGPGSADVAASFLQEHPDATFYVDEAAAAELARISTPWLMGRSAWDDILERRAVIWLATKLAKPILKLTDEDYAENGLQQLMQRLGGSYELNLKVFRRLMGTITGWPAGKGSSRRVLVFSPHPDDDVICMGGTMARLTRQGHEVHVAYMVSGCLSVFDHDVLRHARLVREFNRMFDLTPEQTDDIEESIRRMMHGKKPGDIDHPQVQAIKSFIRRGEAQDAATYCGVAEKNIYFLNMPFYNTGKVQKLSIGPDDIETVRRCIEAVRPDVIFAASDLSDPHGTHQLCERAGITALKQYLGAGNPEPELWLYRGAWQEWPLEQVDMAVPLSPTEVKHKRFAIFRHQSQKDRAMFPGPYDSREFWQRAEERNKATAVSYDALGLPEYHAIEAFVRYPCPRSAHTESQLTRLEP